MLTAARYLSSLENREFDPKDHRLFEHFCSHVLGTKTNSQTLMWDDINPDIKDGWFLPARDVGVDYVCFNSPMIFGQAKCYKDGGYVNAHDINRTMFCANYAKVQHIEFATRQLNTLGKTAIPLEFKPWDKFLQDPIRPLVATHTRLSDIEFEEFHTQCVAKIPELIVEPVVHMDLRECQKLALNTMCLEDITRIKMACGSGKSYTVIRHILNNHVSGNKYLVLVPSLVLMDQWHQSFTSHTTLKTSMIGTGKDRVYDSTADVFICVYNSFPNWFKTADVSSLEHIYVDEAHHIDKAKQGYLLEIKQILDLEMFPCTMLSATIKDTDYDYSMRTAIDDGILTDYDVSIPVYDRLGPKTIVNVINDHPEYTRVLVYFNTIKRAREFATAFGNRCAVITCEESLSARNLILNDFKSGKYRVIASVNTLGEGVDIKCADTCIFGDYRSSEISIVQCVGRVLRKFPGKNMSHVVVPMCIEDITNDVSPVVLRTLVKLARNDLKIMDKLEDSSSGIQNSRIVVVNKTETTDDDFSKITDIIFNKSFSLSISGNWGFKYSLLKEYYEEHKQFPAAIEMYRTFPIGQWFHNQKSVYKNHKLSKNKIDQLDKISTDWKPDLSFSRSSLSWEENLELVVAYFNEFNAFPESRTKYKNENIGYWYFKQKSKFKNNKLSQERVDKLISVNSEWLASIGKTIHKLTWDESLNLFKQYYESTGSLPVWGTKYHGYDLGRWVARQRSKRTHENFKEQNTKLSSITESWYVKSK